MLFRSLGAGMRRREFLSGLGVAAAWPTAARAQQGQRVRRVGVLMATTSDEPDSQARIPVFRHHRAVKGRWDEHVPSDHRWALAFANACKKKCNFQNL